VYVCTVLYSKKLWWSKSLVKRVNARHWRKNFGNCWLASPITNHQLTVKQSRTIQFQTSMNIIKWTPYFPGFILCYMLVACYLMMVRCTVESMICGYLSFESELDLLKYCNIDILTSILMQNKLKHTSHFYAFFMLQKQKISKKSWRIVVIHQICRSFFLSKVFTVWYVSYVCTVPNSGKVWQGQSLVNFILSIWQKELWWMNK